MGLVNKKFKNFTMALDPRDKGISGVLFKRGGRELAFMKVMGESLKRGDVCVDLGANIGYATLNMAHAAGEDGKVYAIEPDPRNVRLLKENIEINEICKNCEMFQIAISDSNGEISFWQSATPNTSSVHKTDRSQKEIVVPCMTLGSFLEGKEYPNFIKMDVEGHEVQILRGALDYFKRNPGSTKILLEVHPDFYDEKNNFADVLRDYFSIGFNSKYVISTPVACPRLFSEKGYSPVESINTDGFVRGIYNNITNEDLIEFSCYQHEEPCRKGGRKRGRTVISKKIVRSFLIEREQGDSK
jgi:FkbM family methyltransferase